MSFRMILICSLRDSSWGYREPNYQPNYKRDWIAHSLLGGYAWWWVFSNCYYESGHLFGHFPWVHPNRDFTDEELGIPPDEEGLAPVISHVRTIIAPGCIPNTRNYSPYALEKLFGDTGVHKF